MENIKELFAEWGLWSLVEDISDDGDGEGDNLQLTPEGKEASRMVEQELDKAREEVLGEVLSKGRDLSVLHLAPHIPVSDVEEILSKLKANK
ncbi:hypothetical protein GX830_00295 [Candidatus Dojkabacteria bacterium]|nr:hypothetical protein [Candidatus Dojkabacteria bacterium]